MHEVKVTPPVFQEIVNEEINILPIDHMIENDETFIIQEITAENDKMGRSAYATAKQSYTFQKDSKLSWKFWKKPVIKYTSVVLLKLTGMMRIAGEDVVMSELVKDEIYKNLDVDNVVDLKLMPMIVFVNNENKVLYSLKFIMGITENNQMSALNYEIEMVNGSIHKHTLLSIPRVKKPGVIKENDEIS